MTKRMLDLQEVCGKDMESHILNECSKEKILASLILLSNKDDLKKVPTKPGCYFILSRNSNEEEWEFRNIGTFHASIRERLRQHCYAKDGTSPHSQKYEIDKNGGMWAVNYRLIEPNFLRYAVEEILIRSLKPRDNEKHNAADEAG